MIISLFGNSLISRITNTLNQECTFMKIEKWQRWRNKKKASKFKSKIVKLVKIIDGREGK